jgi:hypothetical protein
MAKGSHDERLEQLERENADLRRRVNLLELYVDSGCECRPESNPPVPAAHAWGRQTACSLSTAALFDTPASRAPR